MKNRTGIALLAATVVLGIAVSASAAPVTSTITLGKGWNMISVPTVPLNPDPANVFNDLSMTQDIEGIITRYDPISRSNVSYSSFDPGFGNILIGDGYWVLKTTNGTLNNSYQGVDVTGDHWLSLPRKGWTLLGYPNNNGSVPLASVSVTNGIETKLWDDAVTAGWVSNQLTNYDNTSKSNLSVSTDGLGDDDSIRQGKGYWALSLIDNLALIIPQNP